MLPGSLSALVFWGGLTDQTSPFSVAPNTIHAGETLGLALTGVDTGWAAGTPGTPVFEVSAGVVTSQVITSAGTAVLTLVAPSGVSSITVTDPSMGLSIEIEVQAGVATGPIAYESEDVGLMFPFLVDGEFVVPAAANYTVRDNSGFIIQATTPLSLSTNSTQAFITVPAELNTIEEGKDFENRTVEVQFTYNDQGYRIRQSYRIIPWLNITTTPVDVRSLLGLLDHELSDIDINLPMAYLVVRDQVGANTLTAALSAGNLTTEYANQAVALTAAIAVIPSLQLRAAANTQDDNLVFQRFAKIDFAVLRKDLETQLEEALFSLVPADLRGAQTNLTLLAVSQPTDVITGA